MAAHRKSDRAWRWLTLEHRDLFFFHVPTRFPWPVDEESRINVNSGFPFLKLLAAIPLMQADLCEKADPVWQQILRFFEMSLETGNAIERGDLDAAERRLHEMDHVRPGSAYYAFNLAFIRKTRGDLAGARDLYQRAADAAPRLENMWMNLGEMHEELDENERAIAAYRRALALLPKHPDALESLARLGDIKKVTMHYSDDDSTETIYVSPDEFRKRMREHIGDVEFNDARLHSVATQLRHEREGELAILALEKLLPRRPQDTALRIELADACRLARDFARAHEMLDSIIAADPNNADARYHSALVYFDEGIITQFGWFALGSALEADPNHQLALTAQFRLGPKNTDPEAVRQLAQWSAENHSWRGSYLASVQAASVLGDSATALRCAEQAYRLAPQERDAIFVYALRLSESDEEERTAALIKPVLVAQRGDYLLKYVFAGAVEKLGLPEEAARVLRLGLAEEFDMPDEWRENFQKYLDRLDGFRPIGEIELEHHGGEHKVLRRAIRTQNDESPGIVLIPAAVALPQERKISVRQTKPGPTASLGFVQTGQETTLDPLNLGWFRVHEIDPDAISAEPVIFTLHAEGDATLCGSALQGPRKLPVTWSLYRAPSMEDDPAG